MSTSPAISGVHVLYWRLFSNLHSGTQQFLFKSYHQSGLIFKTMFPRGHSSVFSSIFCSSLVAMCDWTACCGLIENSMAYHDIKIIPGLLHCYFKHCVKNFMIFRNYWDIKLEDRRYLPEKQHKAICLNKHPKQRPTQKHYRYPTKKCYWCLYFMLLEKKSEGSFQPNYTCQACNE